MEIPVVCYCIYQFKNHWRTVDLIPGIALMSLGRKTRLARVITPLPFTRSEVFEVAQIMETILATGAFNTQKILELSGIGIPVVIDQPAAGENLQRSCNEHAVHSSQTSSRPRRDNS